MFFSSCSAPATGLNKFRYKLRSEEQIKFDLFSAVTNYNLPKFLSLLACGAPVDFQVLQNYSYRVNRYYHSTPPPAWGDLPLIHLVAMTPGTDQMLTALIASGADVHVQHEKVICYNNSGNILQNMLYMHLNPHVFQLLIHAGVDVNAVNSKGVSVVTALLSDETFVTRVGGNRPAHSNKIDILQLLIDKGATLTAANVQSMLKLIAANTLTISEIKLLQSCLDKEIDLTPESGGNFLHFLAGPLSFDAVDAQQLLVTLVNKVMLLGTSLNAQDNQGRTPLSLSAQHSRSVFDLLISQVDINLADNEQITPLHYAAQSSLPCLSKLLELGASIEAKDKDGATALHYAVKSEAATAFSTRTTELLDKLADINAVDATGARAIDYAVNSPLLLLLLQRGAVADGCDNAGTTTLMRAIACGNLFNANALLEVGADIWARNNACKSALTFALASPNQQTLAFVQTAMLMQGHATVKPRLAP